MHIFEKQTIPASKMLEIFQLAFLISAKPSPIDQPAIITSMAVPLVSLTAHRRWALVLLAPNHVPGTVWFGPPRSVRWRRPTETNEFPGMCCFQFTRKDLGFTQHLGCYFLVFQKPWVEATLSNKSGQVMYGNSCSIPKKGLSIESHKHHTSDDC